MFILIFHQDQLILPHIGYWIWYSQKNEKAKWPFAAWIAARLALSSSDHYLPRSCGMQPWQTWAPLSTSIILAWGHRVHEKKFNFDFLKQLLDPRWVDYVLIIVLKGRDCRLAVMNERGPSWDTKTKCRNQPLRCVKKKKGSDLRQYQWRSVVATDFIDEEVNIKKKLMAQGRRNSPRPSNCGLRLLQGSDGLSWARIKKNTATFLKAAHCIVAEGRQWPKNRPTMDKIDAWLWKCPVGTQAGRVMLLAKKTLAIPDDVNRSHSSWAISLTLLPA